MGLKTRGLLKSGMVADITVFDPDTIKDNSTYGDATECGSGIDCVLVSGKITVENGVYTGEKSGKIIKRNSQ